MSPLAKKLLIRPDARVLTLSPPPQLGALLAPLPPGTRLDDDAADGPYDVVILFVADRASLRAHADTALAAARSRGVVWICYPKKSAGTGSDINRDAGWEPVTEAGWRAVTQVSVDDTWSALRFRPRDEVGS